MKRKYVFSRARMSPLFAGRLAMPVQHTPRYQDLYIGLRSDLGFVHTIPDEVLYAFRVYDNMSYISRQLMPSLYVVGEEDATQISRLFTPQSYYYNDRPVWKGTVKVGRDLKTYYIYYGYRIWTPNNPGDTEYGSLRWVFTQTPPGEQVKEANSEEASHPILQGGVTTSHWDATTSSYSGITGTITDGRTLSSIWPRWEKEGTGHIYEDPIEEHLNFQMQTPAAGVYTPKDGYEGPFSLGQKNSKGEWYIPSDTRSPIYRLNNVFTWREL